MIPQGAEFHPAVKTRRPLAWRKRTSLMELAGIAAAAFLAAHALPARAQQPKQTGATPTKIDCPADVAGQDLVRTPEIERSNDGILSGTILLMEEHELIAISTGGGKIVSCDDQLVRVFRKVPAGADRQRQPLAPKPDPNAKLPDPLAGPTLRARVGDLVQLRFVNEVDSARFDYNFDLKNKCMEVTAGPGIPPVYPALTKINNEGDPIKDENKVAKTLPVDTYPNCLHASSTANLHFHGTHTNPDTTGDNVYLQVAPLPRDNQGNLTTFAPDVMVGFDEFFKNCTEQLRKDPLQYWPAIWDNDLPKAYRDKQEELLRAYQAKYAGQDVWKWDDDARKAGKWPLYYIGAVPHCFTFPAYTEADWPPPKGSKSPNMGQAPGTHWYHAHKHGSTHLNVIDGMSGAFIIEGKYDDDLNAAYRGYMLQDKEGKPRQWNTRWVPVMVLNQLYVEPNLLTQKPADPQKTNPRFGNGPAGIDMVVNGRLRPKVQMQPGEVQLWRIVNSSPRNAVYFMAPDGFEWRQIAQDGVQFNDDNYSKSQNKPFYMAPANRADLLVRAPMRETESGKPLVVRVQQVMGRSQAVPTPASGAPPGTVLMSIEVKGPPATENNKSVEMPFVTAPRQPPFLADITVDETKGGYFPQRKLTFHSGPSNSHRQHTINGRQFEEGGADVNVVLSAVEEWTIENSTSNATTGGSEPKPKGPQGGGGIIDHPLHIHINPFQVTEFFDPNEKMVDPQTGQLLLASDGKSPVPLYILKGQTPTDIKGVVQCVLTPDDPTTWIPCRSPNAAPPPRSVWWDVFAIPSGRAFPRKDGPDGVIPGHYKMRSRFVDYHGTYVLHCHILVHEDRGMMFSVQVVKAPVTDVRHH